MHSGARSLARFIGLRNPDALERERRSAVSLSGTKVATRLIRKRGATCAEVNMCVLYRYICPLVCSVVIKNVYYTRKEKRGACAHRDSPQLRTLTTHDDGEGSFLLLLSPLQLRRNYAASFRQILLFKNITETVRVIVR